MTRLLAALVMMLLALPASGATYWVRQSASGAATGADSSNAWSIATFNSAAVAGDIALLVGGFTTTPNPANAGTAASRIIYRGWNPSDRECAWFSQLDINDPGDGALDSNVVWRNFCVNGRLRIAKTSGDTLLYFRRLVLSNMRVTSDSLTAVTLQHIQDSRFDSLSVWCGQLIVVSQMASTGGPVQFRNQFCLRDTIDNSYFMIRKTSGTNGQAGLSLRNMNEMLFRRTRFQIYVKTGALNGTFKIYHTLTSRFENCMFDMSAEDESEADEENTVYFRDNMMFNTFESDTFLFRGTSWMVMMLSASGTFNRVRDNAYRNCVFRSTTGTKPGNPAMWWYQYTCPKDSLTGNVFVSNDDGIPVFDAAYAASDSQYYNHNTFINLGAYPAVNTAIPSTTTFTNNIVQSAISTGVSSNHSALRIAGSTLNSYTGDYNLYRSTNSSEGSSPIWLTGSGSIAIGSGGAACTTYGDECHSIVAVPGFVGGTDAADFDAHLSSDTAPALFGPDGYVGAYDYEVAAEDDTRPAPVGPLTATAISASSVRLNWTAVGDDSLTGTATTYDVRYSTILITSANFASATQATGEPSPAVAGSSEAFVVGSLSPSTPYYFALKVADEVPQTSAMSDTALATTRDSVLVISASAGSGGSISPSGSVSVPLNGSQAFTISANTGFHIASVSVDGVSSWRKAYTFTNVTAAHTISATFAADHDTSPPVLGAPNVGLWPTFGAAGWPYLTASGAINDSAVTQASRYGEVYFDPRITDSLGTYGSRNALAVLKQLRALNPNMRLLGYLHSTGVYFTTLSADSASRNWNYSRDLWRAVLRAGPGYTTGSGTDTGPEAAIDSAGTPTILWNKTPGYRGWVYGAYTGSPDKHAQSAGATLANTNLAYTTGSGYPVVDSLVNLVDKYFISHVDDAGNYLYDGLFLDQYGMAIDWTQSPGDSVDFVRAGYASLAALDTALFAAKADLFVKLRQRAVDQGRPNFVLYGNGGKAVPWNGLSGYMLEQWPSQHGATWQSNFGSTEAAKTRTLGAAAVMAGMAANEAHSYNQALHVPTRVSPYYSGVTATDSTAYTSTALRKKVTDYIASMAMTKSTATLNGLSGTPNPSGDGVWWFDEFSVDTTTGEAIKYGPGRNWLGEPIGWHYQNPRVPPGVNLLHSGTFDTQPDQYAWTLAAEAGSSIGYFDTTGSQSGFAVLRAVVGANNAYRYNTSATSLYRVWLSPGSSMELGFTAKSNVRRPIVVSLKGATADRSGLEDDPLWIGDDRWYTYRIPFTVTSGVAESCTVAFWFGDTTGTVMIDDVAIYAGQSAATNIRRFQRGFALYNPAAVSDTVTLDVDTRRITSFHATPLVNDGTFAAANSSIVVPAASGMLLTLAPADPVYSITASAGANGSIGPAGVTQVSEGGSQAYTMTPAPHYHVAAVLVDGVSQGAVTSYTFTNVTANHTISVTFAIDTNTITSSAGANGTIAPLGATAVNYGASQAYTITPSGGYHVLDVLVDGVSQGAVTSYTFTNVTAAHTISATFAASGTTVITTIPGAHGSIWPRGPLTVGSGTSQTFTIIPTRGYVITAVYVDGVNVGPVRRWRFDNITSLHTIEAVFSSAYVSGSGGWRWRR